MVVRRGDVWWADLGPPRGSAPALRRPVVVVQAERFNRSTIRTVIVSALTSNAARANEPGNVRVAPNGSGLSKESVVNVTLTVAVSRSDLLRRVGRLSPHELARVNDGLRLVLGL